MYIFIQSALIKISYQWCARAPSRKNEKRCGPPNNSWKIKLLYSYKNYFVMRRVWLLKCRSAPSVSSILSTTVVLPEISGLIVSFVSMSNPLSILVCADIVNICAVAMLVKDLVMLTIGNLLVLSNLTIRFVSCTSNICIETEFFLVSQVEEIMTFLQSTLSSDKFCPLENRIISKISAMGA